MKIKSEDAQQDATVPKGRVGETADKNKEKEGLKPKKKRKIPIWTLKITIITFVLAVAFSFISEITSSKAHIAIAFMLLILLVVISIIFDSIGVAATSCELAPLLSMASRKVRGSKMAIKLVKNAEKVSNICADVIGDICAIVSGACTVAIATKLVINTGLSGSTWVTILFSSIVSALTVGGKAVMKNVAVNNSKELILFAARVLTLFQKDK